MPSFPAGVHQVGGQNAAPINRALAAEFYAPLITVMVGLRGEGLSLRAIARELERRGILSRHGFPRWHARQVARVVARAGPDPAAS